MPALSDISRAGSLLRPRPIRATIGVSEIRSPMQPKPKPKMREHRRERETEMSNAKVSPSVKIAGVGTLDLDAAHVERTLGKAAAKAAGVSVAIVRRWATITQTSVEAIVGETDEGEDIAILLDSTRYSVKVPVPMVKGAPAPLPLSVTCAAFGESARSLALAPFDGGERKDGTRKVSAYGALPYTRPSGATYTLHVKVTPAADGKVWRVSAILAQ